MKNTFLIFAVVYIITLMTSCASKHHCKGLSAHPNYKSNWAKR